MHEQFLLTCLALAKERKGFCSPNPSVGAVIVHQGKIINQANHHASGHAHAEQQAIANFLDSDIKPDETTTLYVSLEPCNHWGKTPPCTDVIIQSGIKKVYFAYKDPNPIVSKNNTSELLACANIECRHYPLKAVEQFYQSYHFWLRYNRPWVKGKIAQSLDGKIAYKDGQRCYLSNDTLNQFTHRQRHLSDIILTSARTIKLDNPKLNVRYPDSAQIAKPIAILDRKNSLSYQNHALYHTASQLLVFHSNQNKAPKQQEKVRYFAVAEMENKLDLNMVLEKLGELGYHDLWLEAGGTLFSDFLDKRLMQQAYIYVVPQLLGEQAISAFRGKPINLPLEAKLNSRQIDDQWLIECDFK